MKKDFVMRGQVKDFKSTGAFEILNFSGHKTGYAYRLTEFRIWAASGVNSNDELDAIITAGKTVADPAAPDFSDPGTIGVACWKNTSNPSYGLNYAELVDDTFLITQNLILSASDHQDDSATINYFCRFVSEKMAGPEQAVTNYKQYLISDGS